MKLTAVQVAKIIAAQLGALMQMSDFETVREAMGKINANDPLWDMLRGSAEQLMDTMSPGEVVDVVTANCKRVLREGKQKTQ